MSQTPSNGLRDFIYPYYKTFLDMRYQVLPLASTISKSELSRICITDLFLCVYLPVASVVFDTCCSSGIKVYLLWFCEAL